MAASSYHHSLGFRVQGLGSDNSQVVRKILAVVMIIVVAITMNLQSHSSSSSTACVKPDQVAGVVGHCVDVAPPSEILRIMTEHDMANAAN